MERRSVQPVHTQNGDVVVAVERGGIRAEALAVHELDQRVLLPCDDVRRRHNEAARSDPPRPLHAEPARCAEHAHDARPRREDCRRSREARIRWRHRRNLAGKRRERVDPGKRSEQLARRDNVVQMAEERRALRGVPQAGLAGDEQRDGAEHPDDDESRDGAEHETAGVVERAPRR